MLLTQKRDIKIYLESQLSVLIVVYADDADADPQGESSVREGCIHTNQHDGYKLGLRLLS